jgi:hypothetical protein
MVVGGKDRRLHAVHAAPTDVLLDAHEEITVREAQHFSAPGCMSRYSQILRVSFGLPLPPAMRTSSAISGPPVSGVGELQGLDANLVALAAARGALDDVDQLAHVARPAIAAQARLGIVGQPEDSAVTAGEPIREVAR